MSTTTTTRFSYSRSRSPSPYGKPRVMFATRDDDATIRNMCRPPAGWHTTSTIPPLRTRSRSSSWRESSTFNRQPKPVQDAFDQHFKKIDQEVEKMHGYMDKFVDKIDNLAGEVCKKPEQSSTITSNEEFKGDDELVATPEPVEIVESDGQRRLVYSLDLQGFRPQDIKVNLCTDDGVVTVDACHVEKDNSHFLKRHYSRKFTIPEHLKSSIRQSEIRSFFTDKGVLTVEAPLPRKTPHRSCNVVISNTVDGGSDSEKQMKETGYSSQTLPNYYTQKQVGSSNCQHHPHCVTCKCTVYY